MVAKNRPLNERIRSAVGSCTRLVHSGVDQRLEGSLGSKWSLLHDGKRRYDPLNTLTPEHKRVLTAFFVGEPGDFTQPPKRHRSRTADAGLSTGAEARSARSRTRRRSRPMLHTSAQLRRRERALVGTGRPRSGHGFGRGRLRRPLAVVRQAKLSNRARPMAAGRRGRGTGLRRPRNGQQRFGECK
jgi:hypothetical protein